MTFAIVRAKGGVQMWAHKVEEKTGIVTAWTHDEKLAARVSEYAARKIGDKHLATANGGALKFIDEKGHVHARCESPEREPLPQVVAAAARSGSPEEVAQLREDLELESAEVARLTARVKELEAANAKLERESAAAKGAPTAAEPPKA